MEYKKIIKDRNLRLKILRLLSFIPDRLMLEIQYRIKTGHKLNLKDPVRFTEKIQWYKLYYKNPLMIQCVDKYDVREYVKSKGLEKILVPCYGVFDSADDIDWDALPDQFVMKDTLGVGGTSVVIVKDKSKEDRNELKRKAKEWTETPAHRRDGGREWPYYSGKKHRIIIEKYLSSADDHGLMDYKFFCFSGRTEFIYVMGNRKLGERVKVRILNRDFERLPVLRVGDEDIGDIQEPIHYDKMLAVAEKLSGDFPHVRVDLYNLDGQILFGELTFYNASGYMIYDPDNFDFEIGKKFTLLM